MSLDYTSILRIPSSKKTIRNKDSELLDSLRISDTDIIEPDNILTVYQHSAFLNDVVAYISVFLVHKIKNLFYVNLYYPARKLEK